MKGKFLKLNKACSEQWGNMTPNEKGSFCDVCAKNVIDFTQLSPLEISEKIKNSKGEICARLTKQQLATPLIDLHEQKVYKLPYSNIAASVLLASTLAVCTTSCAQNEKAPTEFVQTASSLSSKSNIKRPQTKQTPTAADSFVTFKGKVNTDEGGKPVENVKITFVTIQKILTTYSLADGTFSLEIPSELIDDDNVIRVSYREVTTKSGKRNDFGYDDKDHILSKEEMSSAYTIKAYPLILILGGIGHVTRKHPIVIENQKKINYKDFVDAQYGKKTSCDLENKDYLYFESEAAVAIYGKGAEAGLFILVDKTKK
ncbi:hypothetical protein [uncultured Kordia sp.]|uniref:hypothetical protein n=1 Tax=uncultured Kordia sp. TaxID=507699 RepID=UPI00262F215A|nr:hypothetical protein [uncultured Kordia sp.]